MIPILRIISAIDAAATWDDYLGPMYLQHILEVAGLVAQATEEADLDLVVVALLHHAITDGKATFDIIERHW
jgi:(p)ppGpp synthase/HD superfamily hydrolase